RPTRRSARGGVAGAALGPWARRPRRPRPPPLAERRPDAVAPIAPPVAVHRQAGDDQAQPAGFFGGLRAVGQVLDGYLICEGNEQLVLIDQHAAHERVTFERLRAAYASGLVPRQQLLVPTVLEVGPREAALLREQIDTLDGVGFEIEPYAGGAFAVRAVPALLADTDAAVLLRDVTEDLAD